MGQQPKDADQLDQYIPVKKATLWSNSANEVNELIFEAA